MMNRQVMRAALWIVICCTCALPSFIWSRSDAPQFPITGILPAVGFYVALYAFVTGTEWFSRLYHHRYVRRTLIIAYSLRVGVSAVFPVGMGIDLLPGLASVSAVRSMDIDIHDPFGTFLITLIQGALLNIEVILLALIIQGVQKLTKPRDPFTDHELGPQGFEILPVAQVQGKT